MNIRAADNNPSSPPHNFIPKRRTYYTPPRKEQASSRIPGKVFNWKSDENATAIIGSIEQGTKRKRRTSVDEFGWFQDEDELWKNEFSGATSKECPY